MEKFMKKYLLLSMLCSLIIQLLPAPQMKSPVISSAGTLPKAPQTLMKSGVHEFKLLNTLTRQNPKISGDIYVTIGSNKPVIVKSKMDFTAQWHDGMPMRIQLIGSSNTAGRTFEIVAPYPGQKIYVRVVEDVLNMFTVEPQTKNLMAIKGNVVKSQIKPLLSGSESRVMTQKKAVDNFKFTNKLLYDVGIAFASNGKLPNGESSFVRIKPGETYSAQKTARDVPFLVRFFSPVILEPVKAAHKNASDLKESGLKTAPYTAADVGKMYDIHQFVPGKKVYLQVVKAGAVNNVVPVFTLGNISKNDLVYTGPVSLEKEISAKTPSHLPTVTVNEKIQKPPLPAPLSATTKEKFLKKAPTIPEVPSSAEFLAELSKDDFEPQHAAPAA